MSDNCFKGFIKEYNGIWEVAELFEFCEKGIDTFELFKYFKEQLQAANPKPRLIIIQYEKGIASMFGHYLESGAFFSECYIDPIPLVILKPRCTSI